MICPCQQQQANAKSYTDCCQPLHHGQSATTPEQLMRSRFSGFALGLTPYIKKTWHPDTCPNTLELELDDQWLKLDIIASSSTQVHFKAYFKQDDTFQCLEEISNFVFQDTDFYYVDGDTKMHSVSLNRNDTCLCGSGKKYKKCCGKNS